MPSPSSVSALTDLGRVRLSEHFFMREMLYSEVANFHGMSNMPEDPELAIKVGQRICEDLLEPMYRTFGHVTVRSAYRSPSVNAYCNQRFVESKGQDESYYCSDNVYSAARHIWDLPDKDGHIGGTVSVVIPWYIEKYEKTKDPRPLGWWIRDHIPAYGQVLFFNHLCAFNIRWYDGPTNQPIAIDAPEQDIMITDNTMDNFNQDHSALYADFPS